ncbi:MAG: DUF4357 domain-containing protein [Clostridia bacterium]|nr:DUF4357 domain-containing protein [Clostridia bacterium]
MAEIISIRLENEKNSSIKVVNIVGKTTKMISFSRSAYSLVKEFNKKDPVQYFDYDLARPGVYMLFSEDNKSIYIGESDSVVERLNTHYSTNEKTEYWTNTMVFVADGTYPLNISQIKYIESKLIEYAKSISQVQIVDIKLKNKKSSQLPNISINDKVVAEKFLTDVITITKMLGLDYFDINKTIITPEEIATKEIFKFVSKNYDAKLIRDGDSFVVLAESKISKNVSKSCKQCYVEIRKLLLENGNLIEQGNYLVATKNIPFDSASTAANIVSGRSANGKIEWKTESGKTIKDFE